MKQLLGIEDGGRLEWDAYDLDFGDVKVEVKSAAYIQVWDQTKHSKITFDIAKKTPWFAKTNSYGDSPVRSADVYVFCMWEARDEETADVLDLEQWGFYAVLTSVLEATFGDQKTFGLSSLERVSTRVPSAELKATVDKLQRSL